MKYAFILNPAANSSRALHKTNWLKTRIVEYWPDAEFFLSDKPGDVKKLAKKLSIKYDILVACGGDGTINQLVEGIIGSDAIGAAIPMGSGNDFAKALGISANPDKALEQLKHAKPTRIDIVSYIAGDESGIFNNTLGVGFDGWANYYAQEFKNIKGSMRYPAAAIKTVLKHRAVQYKLIIDGVELNEPLLMVTLANGSVEGGNFKVAPHADISDGLLDILTIQPVSKTGLLLRLPFFIFGWHSWFRAVKYHKCKEIKIYAAEPVAVHMDGEQLGLTIREVHARILPGAVRFMLPFDR